MTQLEWLIEETKKEIALEKSKSRLHFLESLLETLLNSEEVDRCMHERTYSAPPYSAICEDCGAGSSPNGIWGPPTKGFNWR